MSTIKLKSEKRLKQVDTSSENANTYESGDVVYDSNGNKFRTSNGSAWSDLAVPATVADIGSIGNVDAIGSNTNRGRFLKVKGGADEIEYAAITIPGAIGDLSDVGAIGSNTNRGKILKVADGSDAVEYNQVDEAIAGLYDFTGADGTNHYSIAGPGITGTVYDPTLYLVRGRKYQFKNSSGGHTYHIQTDANGNTSGTVYTDGITYPSSSEIANGSTATWEVQLDAPAELYYQCKTHANMGGVIKILDGSGGGGGATNLSISNQSGTTLRIESSTGTNVDLPIAGTGNNAGLMSDGDFDKLAAYPAFASFNFTSIADTPSAYAGSQADANKFVKVNGSGDGIEFADVNFPAPPMFATKTLSGNTNILTELNGGNGGTLVVSDSSQNAAGSNSGNGFTLNTASLSQARKDEKARYEIISGLGSKGFRFKADTTAIDSFGGGQPQISAGTGNTDGVSVSDAQKLVLLYTGAAWKYMIQAI